MNLHLTSRHQTLFSVFAACLFLPASLSFGLGELKTQGDIATWDILGEGCVALFSSSWVFFLLASRPPGRVTTGLVLGLCCFMFSAMLDFFDEFVHYDNAATSLSLIESVPAAVGMIIMSYALWLWHQEQLALNRQLCRREFDAREHHKIDFITQLYSADYMRGQINARLRANSSGDFSVVMLDIDNFDAFNREYGSDEGDRRLREISELILMNLRTTDLACRYAGDQFILLLPDTTLTRAQEIAEHIRTSTCHLAFKTAAKGATVYHSLTFAAAHAQPDDAAESIIHRVSQRINLTKQKP